jgi:hypothetical protein
LSRYWAENKNLFRAIIWAVNNFLLEEIWAENQNTFEQVFGQ